MEENEKESLLKHYSNRRMHFIFPGLVTLGGGYGNWSWVLEEGATFQGMQQLDQSPRVGGELRRLLWEVEAE